MVRALCLLLFAALMASLAPSLSSPAAAWLAPNGAVFDSPEHGWQTACDEARSEALPVCPAARVDRLPAVYGVASAGELPSHAVRAGEADRRSRIRHHFRGRHVPRMRSGDPPIA